ncbi:arginine--tRNA ligase [Candidatus Profftia tarda]|uniref:Arginine--tRNA ligase n=1 Tax=Candidatus Profftia tarda TaxID=1177216 RepID=A0A8E4F1N2_9ENTR|nr:arginine--tRNA ligase [Candidatus Profftia tarda]CAD6511670.1 Arginine--tRNA ligase [Candidatus Profftia tarda]
MNIKEIISVKVIQALEDAGAPAHSNPLVSQTMKKQFGDYQVNGIIGVANKLGIASRQLAQRVLNHLDLKGIASKVEIAGPGFMNIFLDSAWIAKQVKISLEDDRLGISPVKIQTIVVDYSSPNVAKEMHIGHLRSTIMGDASVRTLEFLGHKVIRANHIGDWGTQFGMLIAYFNKNQNKHVNDMNIADLESAYREAHNLYYKDPEFAENARAYVVKLQGGCKVCKNIWQKIVDITMLHNQKSYNRLKVTLTKDDVMGESMYHTMIPEIVADLKDKGLAIESEGAIVVFLEDYKNKHNKPMGIIIQKKDSGYLYATSDIACAKYRYETLGANRILYYIDSRQHQHLMQTWSIVRKAGYVPDSVSLEHHMFGMMLGKDGKPFKTRAGSNIKLSDLLDEAVNRASKLIAKKNKNLSYEELEHAAEVVGIGAIKYADLSKSRTTDYIFDWDKMLSFDGNTAPYIQYAYTRISSIFKRIPFDSSTLTGDIILTEECEKSLAISLIQFEEIITQVAREGTAHIMCSYLYNLAGMFSSFYEHCPILKATSESQRKSRLELAALTARTLKIGLGTLGIETVERM